MSNRLTAALIGLAIIALILMVVLMTSLSKVALVGGAVLVLGFGAVRLLGRFGINDMAAPLITKLACGTDELRLTHTRQTSWGNSHTTLQFHFNGRLVDLRGEGWELGRFTARPIAPGSGLRFYPAARRPDELRQEQVGPLGAAEFEYVVWVSPRRFTPAEFARLAACCRAHADVINRALSVSDITLLKDRVLPDYAADQPYGILTRLVYDEAGNYHAADLTYQSQVKNGSGGYDVLVLDAYGSVQLQRPDANRATVSDGLGRRQPGTDTLVLALPGPKANLLMLQGLGPLPTLAELARFEDKQGRPLSESFQLIEAATTPAL